MIVSINVLGVIILINLLLSSVVVNIILAHVHLLVHVLLVLQLVHLFHVVPWCQHLIISPNIRITLHAFALTLCPLLASFLCGIKL